MMQTVEIIVRAILTAFAVLFVCFGISTIRTDIREHREFKQFINTINEITKQLKNYKL